MYYGNYMGNNTSKLANVEMICGNFSLPHNYISEENTIINMLQINRTEYVNQVVETTPPIEGVPLRYRTIHNKTNGKAFKVSIVTYK